MIKKKIYKICLKSMLKNADKLALTGKQRSQILGLMNHT